MPGAGRGAGRPALTSPGASPRSRWSCSRSRSTWRSACCRWARARCVWRCCPPRRSRPRRWWWCSRMAPRVTPTMALISGGRYAGTATLSPDWQRPGATCGRSPRARGGQSATSWVQFKIDSGGPDQRLELMSGDDQFEINLLAGAPDAGDRGRRGGRHMPAAAPAGLVPLSDAYRIRLSSGQTALARVMPGAAALRPRPPGADGPDQPGPLPLG